MGALPPFAAAPYRSPGAGPTAPSRFALVYAKCLDVLSRPSCRRSARRSRARAQAGARLRRDRQAAVDRPRGGPRAGAVGVRRARTADPGSAGAPGTDHRLPARTAAAARRRRHPRAPLAVGERARLGAVVGLGAGPDLGQAAPGDPGRSGGFRARCCGHARADLGRAGRGGRRDGRWRPAPGRTPRPPGLAARRDRTAVARRARGRRRGRRGHPDRHTQEQPRQHHDRRLPAGRDLYGDDPHDPDVRPRRRPTPRRRRPTAPTWWRRSI